jgi:2-amino-4-hydroxy-6-hydroxymethyldihydropteridine diphosphokinase
MQHTIYLALGTNLGERPDNLRLAREALPPAVVVEVCSPIYETAPWGYADQPAFLNQVLKAVTQLSPQDLLAYLKQIETRLGRQESFRNGPRLIDIDILFYDDLILDTPELVIPHPRMEGRAFVWAPLADIAPYLRHPILGRTPREVLATIDTQGIELYKGN